MIVQQNESLIGALAGIFAGKASKKAKAARMAAPAEPSLKDTMQTSFPLPRPANDNQVGTLHRLSKAEARADLARIVKSYRLPSQDKLALRWGRPKGTVSKWLKQFEAEGLILRKAVAKRKEIYAN